MSPRWTIRSLSLCAAASLAAAAAFSGVAAADPPLAAAVQSKLTASDPLPGDRFGNAVALSGDTALVGLRPAFQGGPDPPALSTHVHVFVRHGDAWTEEAELGPDAEHQSNQFGISIAIDGDTAVVGDGADTAAYLFTRQAGTWSVAAKLGPTDPSFSSVRQVALSGQTAATLAMDGTVYVFSSSSGSWSLESILLPAANGGVGYGRQIAVSGDSVVVSGLSEPGASAVAHVFVRQGGTWTDEATLTPTLAPDQLLGPVSISGDTVVVNGAQSAHVFARQNGVWTEPARLVGGPIAASGNAAISGDVIALPEVAYRQTDAGSVQVPLVAVFRRAGDGWAKETVLGVDSVLGPTVDTPVAISGDTILLGVPQESPDHGGTVYAIVLRPETASAGCNCRVGAGAPPGVPLAGAAALGLAIALRRRRRG
jgi:MYXO-CTERM domain-containing protein